MTNTSSWIGNVWTRVPRKKKVNNEIVNLVKMFGNSNDFNRLIFVKCWMVKYELGSRIREWNWLRAKLDHMGELGLLKTCNHIVSLKWVLMDIFEFYDLYGIYNHRYQLIGYVWTF